MYLSLRGIGLAKCGLLTFLALGMAPAAGQAAWLGFRNDTDDPVILQVTQAARVGKAQVLYPGEVAWSSIVQPGPRHILIYEVRTPGRLLFRTTVSCGADDLFFSVQSDSPARNKLVADRPSHSAPGQSPR